MFAFCGFLDLESRKPTVFSCLLNIEYKKVKIIAVSINRMHGNEKVKLKLSRMNVRQKKCRLK